MLHAHNAMGYKYLWQELARMEEENPEKEVARLEFKLMNYFTCSFQLSEAWLEYLIADTRKQLIQAQQEDTTSALNLYLSEQTGAQKSMPNHQDVCSPHISTALTRSLWNIHKQSLANMDIVVYAYPTHNWINKHKDIAKLLQAIQNVLNRLESQVQKVDSKKIGGVTKSAD